jgi:hypothetical protein
MASSCPVTDVVGVRAQVEVVGSEASRIVTAVEDVQVAFRVEVEVESGGEPVD